MTKISAEAHEIEEKSIGMSVVHLGWSPDSRVVVLFVSLTIASLVVAIDATVLVTILPIITDELHGSVSDAFWTGTTYLLASAVSQPMFSASVDSINLRLSIAVALLFFSVGSALCAQAASFTILLIGRGIKGAGGGGIIALVQVSFAREIPREQRPKWFSLILGAWATGTVAGPFIGSGLTRLLDYRWVFWINIPLNWISFCLLPWTVASHELWFKQPCRKRTDWIGYLLFTLSITGLLLGVSWGGADFPWTDYRTLLPLIVGVCGLGTTGLWIYISAQGSFITTSLFTPASLSLTYVSALLQGLTLYCALYYIPLYFTAVRSRSPLASAVLLLPLSCSMLPVSAVSSRIMAMRQRFQWAMTSGWLCIIAGAAHLTLLDERTTGLHTALILSLLGIGSGLTLSSINFAVQSIPISRIAPFAATTYTFMRSLGMCLGVAVGSNIFQIAVRTKLEASGIDKTLMDSLFEQLERHIGAENLEADMALTLQAFCYRLHIIYWTMAAAGAVGLICSLFISEKPVEKRE